LDEQGRLLQQNTEQDDLFSQQTAARHRELEKEQADMGRLLKSHDRSITEDCVQRTAFSEVSKLTYLTTLRRLSLLLTTW